VQEQRPKKPSTPKPVASILESPPSIQNGKAAEVEVEAFSFWPLPRQERKSKTPVRNSKPIYNSMAKAAA